MENRIELLQIKWEKELESYYTYLNQANENESEYELDMLFYGFQKKHERYPDELEGELVKCY